MINSTLCYLEKDGAWLMLHRVKKTQDPNAGKWIGVGGKFEEGESPRECVIREVREETGLSLTKLRFRGLVTFVSDLYETEYMHLFTAAQWEGTLSPERCEACNEGVLRWIPIKEVETLPLWEGDRYFLKALREREDFFTLKLVYEGDSLKKVVWEDDEKEAEHA